MGMISGGFGLKKFFEDSDREKEKPVIAPVPEGSAPEANNAQVRTLDLSSISS